MKKIKVILTLFIQIIFILNSSLACADDDNNKILINIPSRTLELIKDNETTKTYSIGVGRPGFPTPVGNFKVISKIVNPSWENPYKPAGECMIRAGKSCPLGTRWIGFHQNKLGEYGIHGTNEPKSVGKFSSHGCIRMYIKDSEEIFNQVNKDTPVKVSYYTYKLFIRNKKLIVYKYPNIYHLKVNAPEMIKEQLSVLNGKYIIDNRSLNRIFMLKNNNYAIIGKIDSAPEE